jgi:DNA-binding GntR family transcriptional regulator
LRRRRLVDDATHALREAILEGRFPLGARLRQVDLATRLGISRTPIREALVTLQQEGLIELTPGGGVRVAALDLDAAVELYDVREVLDGLAARLAARHIGDAGLRRLGRSLAKMHDCVARDDANQWFGAHVTFHDEIFRGSGNARLRALSSVVRLSIRRFHPVLLTTEHRLRDAYQEHRAIYAAIAARDPETAERLAREHIENAKEIALKVTARGASSGDGGRSDNAGEGNAVRRTAPPGRTTVRMITG